MHKVCAWEYGDIPLPQRVNFFLRCAWSDCNKIGQNVINRLRLLVFVKILKFPKLRILTTTSNEKRKCKKMLSATDKGQTVMKVMRIDNPDAGLDGMTMTEEAEPGKPGEGQIKVRLLASSLNFHDYGVASGRMPPEKGRIPLSDGAGVVEAVGNNVTALKPGDRVVSVFFPDWETGGPTIDNFSRTPGDGIDGYARDCVITPANWFTRSPAGWSHQESATITTAGLTAWRALAVEAKIKPGDTVLLLGTGGVSIYALQIAKACGARVAITSSSDEKLEKAEAMGADYTINYREHDNWGEKVREWTGGEGVDHVVEVGGPVTLANSIDACRVGGNIVLIGVLTGLGGEVPTADLMRKQITLTGIIVGSHQHQRDFVKALETMKFKPVIDKSFTLDNLADAFRYEESGAHFGKICITI